MIDDNSTDNHINKTILIRSGFSKNIFDFNSASKAEARLDLLISNSIKTDLPDILFLDINMPGINGFEFLKTNEEKLISLNPSFKTVFLTSSLSSYDITKASLFKTYLKYIAKPLNQHTLSELTII